MERLSAVVQRFRGWLRRVPVDDPNDQPHAALLQMLLLGGLLAIGLGILANAWIVGPDVLTLRALLPNLFVMLCVVAALVVVRHGYFRWSVALVTSTTLVGLSYSLLTRGFSNNEDSLIIFVIPITLAGLVLTRRGLLLTVGLSIGTVVGVAIWEHLEALWQVRVTDPPTMLNLIVLRFVLVIGLLAFLLERFGRMRAHTLALQVAERTRQLAEANQQLQDQARQLEQMNHQLLKLSYLDQLTGVANRRQFDATLEWEWRRAERISTPLSLIMLDIDDFKRYNDTYGHQRGDACLQQVAQALRQGVQRTSDVVARYGGEEFAVILPGSDVTSAAALAEKLRVMIQELAIPHVNSSVGMVVTVTLGIATITPSHDCTTDALVALADQALYDAKRGGRNRYAVALPKGIAVLEPVAVARPEDVHT